MWYRGVNAFYYVTDVVYRVFEDGLWCKTDYEIAVVCGMCDRIDMPSWGNDVLRSMAQAFRVRYVIIKRCGVYFCYYSGHYWADDIKKACLYSDKSSAEQQRQHFVASYRDYEDHEFTLLEI